MIFCVLNLQLILEQGAEPPAGYSVLNEHWKKPVAVPTDWLLSVINSKSVRRRQNQPKNRGEWSSSACGRVFPLQNSAPSRTSEARLGTRCSKTSEVSLIHSACIRTLDFLRVILEGLW